MKIRATSVLSNSVPNYRPDLPSFFEALDEAGRVIGTLTIFAPTTEEGEITAFVQPSSRGKGVFHALLNDAKAVLKENGYRRVLFVCTNDSAEGQAVAAHWELALDHAEYFMVWNGTLPEAAPLALRPAGEADIPALVQLYTGAFQKDRDQALHFVQSSLPTYQVARRDGQLVGAANVQDGEVLGIYSVAVSPAMRGKGWGQALMAALLRSLSTRRPTKQITLEVDSANERALRLYGRCGFVTARREDYFLMPL